MIPVVMFCLCPSIERVYWAGQLSSFVRLHESTELFQIVEEAKVNGGNSM
jgi:hypothetical protein